MRVLIAEDDVVSRHLLKSLLLKWGYDVTVTTDGQEAWDALQQVDAPELAIIDWAMPEIDGADLCRKLQGASNFQVPYMIMLTARQGKENVVEGLQAGFDDYVTKPFDPDELLARIQAGERVLGLRSALADRLTELEDALLRIRRLQGLLPICASCKKIRDDAGYWSQIEFYIREHSEAEFSHSICPPCFKDLYPDEYSELFPKDTPTLPREEVTP